MFVRVEFGHGVRTAHGGGKWENGVIFTEMHFGLRFRSEGAGHCCEIEVGKNLGDEDEEEDGEEEEEKKASKMKIRLKWEQKKREEN